MKRFFQMLQCPDGPGHHPGWGSRGGGGGRGGEATKAQRF